MQTIIGKDPSEAARRLVAGELVALPTETVYGLGANALDPLAVSKVFSAKNRPSFDPLIIHQFSAADVFAYASEIPELALRLAETCWPGPLTLVLPRRATVPDLVTAGLPTVALRVPAHPLTRKVLEQLDFPVAAPSANPFGFVSPVTAVHVAAQLGGRVNYILDGGRCAVGLESTIVGFPGGEPTVFRKGGITTEQLAEICGRPLAVRTHGSSRPAAPGMLSRHYSPGTDIELVADAGDRRADEHHAVVRFGGGIVDGTGEFNLSPGGDLEEAARNLFSVLRELSAADFNRAVIELVPEEGLGRAINDRLRRAAARE